MERKSKIDLIEKKEFKSIVEKSNSISDVLAFVGYKNKSGAAHNKVKERIEREKISTSHMISLNSYKKNRNGATKIPIEEILIENSTYTNLNRLKIRIVNEKILKYECFECGNEGMWNEKKLSLHLDHKNGINNDHRIENLRFLCPNCHSQTETYNGKNQGRYK